MSAELEIAGKQTQKNTAGSGVIKYDFDESFGKQLDDWLYGNSQKNGSYNGKYFVLGTTPDILLKHGASSLEFIVDESVIAKVTGMKGDDAHVIAIDDLAKLPSQMNDPILLFKGSVPDSFVALTEITTKQGHDVIVAIHINKKNGRAHVNKIVSAYSKTNSFGYNKIVGYVNSQINEGNLIDGNIIKATNWFTSKGLQLPKLVQTILVANNSISDKSEKSNSFDWDFKKNSYDDAEYLDAVKKNDIDTQQRFVDEAAERNFRNSKARDSAGKLIKVYHGTESEVFYEFDKAPLFYAKQKDLNKSVQVFMVIHRRFELRTP